jgi:hypothetical protein
LYPLQGFFLLIFAIIFLINSGQNLLICNLEDLGGPLLDFLLIELIMIFLLSFPLRLLSPSNLLLLLSDFGQLILFLNLPVNSLLIFGHSLKLLHFLSDWLRTHMIHRDRCLNCVETGLGVVNVLQVLRGLRWLQLLQLGLKLLVQQLGLAVL